MKENKIIILSSLPLRTGKVHQGDYVIDGGVFLRQSEGLSIKILQKF